MVDQVIVHEVTMAMPDCICVEIWDGEPERGRIQYLTTPDSGAQDHINGNYIPVYVTRPNPFHGGANESCKVIGADKKALRFLDKRPTQQLGSTGRTACKNPANWSVTGRTVTAVYYKNRTNYFYRDIDCQGIIGGHVVLKHLFFLKLDANLTAGAKTITPPAATGLSPIAFTFDDRVTRAMSIHATQVSHKPADECKHGVLSLWLPGYGTHGIVDFDGTYGLMGTNKFEVINAGGTMVYTGNVTLLRRARDYDHFMNYRGGNTDYFMTVLNVTAGAGGVIRITLLSNTGFVNGMEVNIGSGSNGVIIANPIGGVPGANGTFTISVPAGNHTDIDLVGTTFSGSYTGGGVLLGQTYQKSPSLPPTTITGFTIATQAVFTAPGHTLVNGDVGFMDDWDDGTLAASRDYGSSAMKGYLVMVSDVSGSTFKLKYIDFNFTSTFKYIDTTTGFGPGYPAPNSCAGKFYPAWLCNKTGSDTFLFDYSAWTSGVEGTYRVRIPGLGVSDPFYVGPQAWYDGAAFHAKGEYAQRIGMVHDNRFGFPRPADFVDTDLNPNLLSTLPVNSTTYSVVVNLGGVPLPAMGAAGYAPWITTTRVPFIGGWHDAGDWDQVLLSHLQPVYWLAEMYLSYPGARASTFNIPKSSTILNASTYAAADVLGDLAHQVIWELEWLRLAQDASGWVPSAHIYTDSAGNTDSPGWYDEPSWLNRNKHVVCAGEHVSTYLYAACAAKLAQIFKFAGLTTLQTLWQNSAVLAFNWSESMTNNTTTRDNYYNGTLGMQTKMGWTTTQYNAHMSDLNTAAAGASYGYATRAMAAACLFRLTGTASYSTVFLASRSEVNQPLPQCGNWDYYNSVGADATWLANHGVAFWKNQADQPLIPITGPFSYPHAKHYSDEAWGANGTHCDFCGPLLIPAHRVSGESKYVRQLMFTMLHQYGVNPLGYCFTFGLGQRNFRGQLNLDTLFGDGHLDVPLGYDPYNYARPGYEIALFQGNPEPNQWITNHLDLTTYPDSINRYQEPTAGYYPWWERVYEEPYAIGQMEFTVHQSTIPHLFSAIYLAARDGSVPSGDTPPPVQSTIRLKYRKA